MHINEAPGDLQNGVEYQENECMIQLMRSKEHKTMHLVSHANPIYTGDLQTPVLFIGVQFQWVMYDVQLTWFRLSAKGLQFQIIELIAHFKQVLMCLFFEDNYPSAPLVTLYTILILFCFLNIFYKN